MLFESRDGSSVMNEIFMDDDDNILENLSCECRWIFQKGIYKSYFNFLVYSGRTKEKVWEKRDVMVYRETHSFYGPVHSCLIFRR